MRPVCAAELAVAIARRAKIGLVRLDRTSGRLTMAPVVTTELDARHIDAAVALWEQAGLARPWNDARADFARAVDGPASAVLGGFDGGDLVATAMVGHDGHRGWVYYLAVAPAARGNGHGTAMMAACEEWLRDRGVPKLNLMVRGTNAVAHGFYDALGYGDDDVRVRSKRLWRRSAVPG
jgi:ribosomal protein S18 acetylase RimI-like enzyme